MALTSNQKWGIGAGLGLGPLTYGLGRGGFFKSQPEQFGQLSRYSPEIQEQLNQGIMNLLSQIGSPDYMQNLQQQARKGFEQNVVPSIAERFTSLGEGAQSSGAFAGALGQAGADMENQLALQGAGQQQNLLSSLLGLGVMENFYRPRQASGFENLLSGLIPAAGRAAGSYFSGGLF